MPVVITPNGIRRIPGVRKHAVKPTLGNVGEQWPGPAALIRRESWRNDPVDEGDMILVGRKRRDWISLRDGDRG